VAPIFVFSQAARVYGPGADKTELPTRGILTSIRFLQLIG
jgi:hypothetical protein